MVHSPPFSTPLNTFMHPDTAAMLPQGRPPARVLLTLTLLAAVVHGCVLDGVPQGGLQASAYAAQPIAATVQLRHIAVPAADATVAAAVPTRVAPPAAQRALEGARQTVQPMVQMASGYPVPAPGTSGAEPAEPVSPQVISSETPQETPRETPPDTSPDTPLAIPLVMPLVSATPSSAAASAVVTDAPPLRQPERPVPVYKTRFPPVTTIDYEIRRGGLSGTGELRWRPVNGHYEVRLEASVAGFTLLTQVSQGGFDAAGLAPTRFTDQRLRKAARAANFQREAGKITFSGPRGEFALAAGSQDRLSWMIQLPSVLAAEPTRAAAGSEVVLYVAGARGDVDIWDLRSSGTETLDTPSGALSTVKFTRTPRSARDTRAEVWLDPKRHYLPVRARLTQGESDGALDLVLRELRSGP